ncbi:MAG: polyisoprenoid-binding protein YceI [Myxococcota bacterium]|jgi:polyisoprenoid-binding protein YceI
MRCFFSVIMAAVGMSGAATAGPISYSLDAQDSLLYLTVFKDTTTLAAGMSHDHAIRSAGWSGEAAVDLMDLSSCAISVSLPVASLVVDERWMRRVAGLEGELSDTVRDSVRKNMLGSDQLDAKAHPTMRFTSTHCTASSIEGDLTIHGVTQHIAMPARISATSGGFSLTGRADIRATDYGFEPFTAMMGAMKNQDEMQLTVTLIGTADAAADAQ